MRESPGERKKFAFSRNQRKYTMASLIIFLLFIILYRLHIIYSLIELNHFIGKKHEYFELKWLVYSHNWESGRCRHGDRGSYSKSNPSFSTIPFLPMSFFLSIYALFCYSELYLCNYIYVYIHICIIIYVYIYMCVYIYNLITYANNVRKQFQYEIQNIGN